MSVTAIPVYQVSDVVAAVRQVANRIESGELSAERCVVILETAEGGVDYKAFGKDFTRAHAVGLCFCAAQEIMR
jgi:hypothetical protein